MKVILRGIQNVAERWKAQYYNTQTGNWTTTISGDSENVYRRILAAGETDVEAVDKAIGNKSWTTPTCSECHEHKEEVIEFGESRYENSSVCGDCIKQAFLKLTGGTDVERELKKALNDIWKITVNLSHLTEKGE